MISKESRKLLSELARLNYGKALKELLEEERARLNNVKHCTSWEDTLGRKHAVVVIDRIFDWLKETPPLDKSKNRYE